LTKFLQMRGLVRKWGATTNARNGVPENQAFKSSKGRKLLGHS